MAKKATQTTTAPKENNSAVINVTKLPSGRAGNWLIPAIKVSDRLKVEFYDSLVAYLWDPETRSDHISNFCGMLMTMANAGRLHSEISKVLPKETKELLEYIDTLGFSDKIKKQLKALVKDGSLKSKEEILDKAVRLASGVDKE